MTIGHNKIRKTFLELAQSHKLPQTMLFYGLAGIGKKRIALDLVSHLFCANPPAQHSSPQACGVCQACLMLGQNNHPDCFLIAPTPPKSQGDKPVNATSLDVQPNWTIKTDQFKALRNKLIYHPLMAKHQVVLIDDAEKMTTATANSLLKILEEPRPHQIFILITAQTNKILPTIRSRCAKYYFSPLTDQEAKQIIVAQAEDTSLPDEATLSFLVRCFQGSITNTLKALQSSDLLDFLRTLTAPALSFRQLAAHSKKLATSDQDLNIFLQCLNHYCLEQQK
ncbi:MAG TPA: AAA family ATPase, partial [bacterium]|nr:AAA family ATPase [bacterium]